MAQRHRPKPVTVRHADGQTELVRASKITLAKKRESLKRWKYVKRRVLERDGHRCAWCGSTEKLNVHHREYGREGIDHLVTLCSRCHSKEHHWRAKRSWSPFGP